MAVVLDVESYGKKELKRIKRHFTIRPNKTHYNPNPKAIDVFRSFGGDDEGYHEIHFPMYDYKEILSPNPFSRASCSSASSPSSSTSPPSSASACASSSAEEGPTFPYRKEEYTPINLTFTFDLLTAETDPMKRGRDQDVLVRQALERLHEKHSVFIAAFTGFGKTSTAIYMMCALGLKVGLLCHNDTLKGQWKEEILRFTNGKAKVQIVGSGASSKLDPDADVYIIGVMKAANMHPDDLIDIGTVIIDEAHICSEKAFTNSLLRFRPMYLIGLSATPDRKDGLDGLLDFFFGPPSDFVVRTEVKKFTVFKYKTKWCPEPSYTTVRGEEVINWSKFISDLACIEERWKEIANIAISHPNHKIMILCDRQEMAKKMYHYFESVGESSELLIGTKKTWDKSKRILVAGVKKGGTALNDPSLNLLIIAADTQDVRQMEGRIRQTENVVYVVIDNYRAFERHWAKQKKWFLQRGASIYDVKNTQESHHILRYGALNKETPSIKRRKVPNSISDYIESAGIL